MHFLLWLLFAESVAKLEGTILKETCCEQCGLRYVYWMKRKVTAKTTSFIVANPAAAKKEARELLNAALAKGCDNVPCPGCGWYQKPMVRSLKRGHYRFVLITGLLLLPASAVFTAAAFLISSIEQDPDVLNPRSTVPRILLRLAGLALILGLSLPIVKFFMGLLYDPNASNGDLRLELGQSLACSKDDYLSGRATLPEAQGQINPP